jgi:hypothetical protein
MLGQLSNTFAIPSLSLWRFAPDLLAGDLDVRDRRVVDPGKPVDVGIDRVVGEVPVVKP